MAAAMQSHWRLILSLSCVGFFVNCQPSEPYLTAYLMEHKGLTEAQLDDYVWPFYTYGAFAFLLPIAVATEVWGYRPVIFFGLLCRQAARVILLYGEGVFLMSLMQVTYAAAVGSHTIYLAFAFLATPAHIAPVALTSMSGAYHAGNVVGSLAAQWLHPHVSLTTLFYISWVLTSAGLLLFLAVFPKAVREAPESLVSVVRRRGVAEAARLAKGLYANPLVVLWSAWWVLGYGALETAGNYDQNLFYSLNPDTEFGYVEAVTEAVSAGASLLPALLGAAAAVRLSYPFAVLGCLASAALLLLSTRVSSVTLCVACNAAAMGVLVLQQALSEIAISQCIAATRRYSFVFAFNAFLGRGVSVAVVKVLASQGATTKAYYAACYTQLTALAVVSAALWVRYPRTAELPARGEDDSEG